MSEQRQQSEIEEVNVYKGFPWTHPVLQHHIVFIGGLPRGTRIRSIRQYISHFGKIIWVKIFSNKLGSDDGCYCHLILSHPAEYQSLFESAVHLIDSRQVRIKMWKPAKGGSSYDERLNRRKLFVKNLCLKHSSDMLAAFFTRFGAVEKIELAPNSPGKYHQRFCFVIFKDSASVQRCLEQKKIIYYQTRMRCRSYKEDRQDVLLHAPADDCAPQAQRGRDISAERGEQDRGLALSSLPREVKNHRKLVKYKFNNAQQKQSDGHPGLGGAQNLDGLESSERLGNIGNATPAEACFPEDAVAGISSRRHSPPGTARVKVRHSSVREDESTPLDRSVNNAQIKHLGLRVQYYTIIGRM
jgi:RNA recognition motif-containing protein